MHPSVLRPSHAFAVAAAIAMPSLAQNPAGSGPDAARRQAEALRTPEGIELTLFASEPLVRNPTNLDIDARGRVWVTEGVNYRLWQKWGKLEPAGDRIVILEDSDLDGRADTQKTFYQGDEINAALGICVLGSRVIVSCSPNILVFEDLDGDDRADGPPRKLFTGIKGVDHDHGAHAAVFGPDGRLYFNFGNEGRQLMDADGNPVRDLAGNIVADHGKPYREGMVFRCDLDGSNLETIAWNFRNNYETAVDSFGALWQSDNDDDGNQGVRINFVMEFGNYGFRDEMTGAGWNQKRTNLEEDIPRRHWHLNDPGVVPNLLQTGAGSPTGMCVYEGDLLPEPFRNQMIHCDAGPRVVRAYPVTPAGAGYSARIVDLITTEDPWFRPSDVCVAPDGSLYVTDWNDAGVGGHYMADQKLDSISGRVYRVAPAGHKPVRPALDLESAEGAAAALKSPNQATRYLAWTALRRMGASAEPALKTVLSDPNPRMRARALHLLARLNPAHVNAAIRDENPDIRMTGLRIARALRMDVIPIVRQLAEDPNPQVRRECAIALRGQSSPEAPKLWAKLARRHDGRDRWYLEALGIGAEGQWDSFLAAYIEAEGDPTRTAAGRDIVWRSRARGTPSLLAAILRDPATPETDKPRYFRAFDFQTGPEKETALLELLTASAE